MAESVMGIFKTELHRNPAALAANGGPVRLRRWGEGDLRFVGCRPTPGYEQHPRPTETEHDARFVLAVDLSAKNLGPEGSRSPSVSHDEDLSDIDAHDWVPFRDTVFHHDYRFARAGRRSSTPSPCYPERPISHG